MIGTRTTQIAVMVLALVALVAPVVHAGGAGQGEQLNGFALDCYQIEGSNPPHELSVDDQFFPGDPGAEPPIPGRTGVKLGKAKLLCTPATVTVASGTLMPGDFTTADHLKCYEAPPREANPRVDVQVADPFDTETVTVGVTRFVCVGAFKCPVGETCPPE
jgi:hypothetical protein